MNYCFTLCWNLPSEVEKTVANLYGTNDREHFKHLVIDLGFPLEADVIPDDVEKAKELNTIKLKSIAEKYGSDYVRMENIGVSQNWTQAYKYLKPAKEDVLIGVDPDERPFKHNWVKALGDVAREGNYMISSLMVPAHIPIMKDIAYRETHIAGYRCYVTPGHLNWGLIGIRGEFLDLIGEVPYPEGWPVYGWIEAELNKKLTEHGKFCAILADYHVPHFDYEVGSEGAPRILREWKIQIVHKYKQFGQMTLEKYLEMRKEGKL